QFEKNLGSEGEILTIRDPCGFVIWYIEYEKGSPWPNRTELNNACGPKGDFSIVPKNMSNTGNQNDGSTWTWSTLPFGSPGREGKQPPSIIFFPSLISKKTPSTFHSALN